MQRGLHPLPAALFSSFDLASRPVVAVAISGGSDSTAALLFLRAHLQAAGTSTRILALTVDHGLRAGSRLEAEDTARLCARLDIRHHILSWRGDKPATGLPAAAREARYDLLAAAAREAGTDIVVTGHTLDDQMETVAMRRARGAGIGLAGMAPVTLFEGDTWIARPLLRLRRDALRAFLRDLGIGWVDDPTNADTRFERARLRAEANAAGLDDGGTGEGAAAVIEAAGNRREALSLAAAALVGEHAESPLPGLIHLARGFLAEPGTDAHVHALRILLAVSGGTAHLPDENRGAALLQGLRRPPHRTTLSRALVASRRDGVWMCRESRGLPTRMTVSDGMVWDGRYRIRLADPGEVVEVTASGLENAPVRTGGAGFPGGLAQAAAAAMPRVRRAEDARQFGPCASTRFPGNGLVTPVAAPWARYLSGFDLEVARAVSQLIGAPGIPHPPWRGHIVTRA